jgi:hypothetical protein
MRLAFLLMLIVSTAMLAAEDWGPAQFLVGHWTGEGTGQPGSGSGAFSFAADLAGHVLVRKSFADYPAADGKPAFRHDDLMLVYRNETSHRLQAIYFDSEGHVIPYTLSPAGQGVVFLSDGPPNQMRYRMTFTPTGPDHLKIKFEIAAPNKEFATYIEAGAHRD